MNFTRRLTNRRIRNLCQAHVLDTERKPKRCRNLSARFLNVEQQRIWICDEHFRMHQTRNMIIVEKRDQQIVLVDCRAKEKSDRN
jgi:hypothetical protein